MGIDGNSKVKLMQNIETGEWYTLKVITNINDKENPIQKEVSILEKLKQSVGDVVRNSKKCLIHPVRYESD